MTQNLVSQKEVICRIGKEEYGISVTEVVSIERSRHITNVPNSSPYLLGMIDLRGSVIPLIDLSRIFNNSSIEITDSTRYIVVQVQGQLVGLAVDAATDIVDVPSSVIQQPAMVRSPAVYGIAKLERGMIVLLDIPSMMEKIVGQIS